MLTLKYSPSAEQYNYSQLSDDEVYHRAITVYPQGDFTLTFSNFTGTLTQCWPLGSCLQISVLGQQIDLPVTQNGCHVRQTASVDCHLPGIPSGMVEWQFRRVSPRGSAPISIETASVDCHIVDNTTDDADLWGWVASLAISYLAMHA